MARLLEKYRTEVVPKLMEQCGIANKLAVPRLQKVVINMGVGRAIDDKGLLDEAQKDLARISGQKPVICRARKSVSAFKLREGVPVGCKVTLRGARMYEFLDRLISLAIPRIRDFRGLNPRAFDAAGNFTMGITEQSIFPEVDLDNIQHVMGMDITLVISNGSAERSFELLKLFGMPFRQAG